MQSSHIFQKLYNSVMTTYFSEFVSFGNVAISLERVWTYFREFKSSSKWAASALQAGPASKHPVIIVDAVLTGLKVQTEKRFELNLLLLGQHLHTYECTYTHRYVPIYQFFAQMIRR